MMGNINSQTGHFTDFEQFKIDSYFAKFQNWFILFVFNDVGQVRVILMTLGKSLDRENQSQPSPFDKKFKNQA